MKKIFLGLGIFLIIGLFGAGWFFSGVTYEAGLNPEFDDQEDVGVAEETIQFEIHLSGYGKWQHSLRVRCRSSATMGSIRMA